MKTYIKNIMLILLFSLAFPNFVSYGQVTMSASVIANGGGEITGSHTLVGTIGQAIVGTSGTTLTTGFWNSSTIITGVNDNTVNTIPKEYRLDQNYPNPFNPSTTISYSIPSVETGYLTFVRQVIPSVQLKVYDVLGREVATLVNEDKPAGNYKVNFDASSLASGIYYYRIIAGKFVQTKKMILLK